MDTTQTLIENYLAYCNSQKRLDEKTLKAYRIDLRQFSEQTPPVEFPALSSAALEAYIAALHRQYKPKTVKRKIASVKAFFHYLEYKNTLPEKKCLERCCCCRAFICNGHADFRIMHPKES